MSLIVITPYLIYRLAPRGASGLKYLLLGSAMVFPSLAPRGASGLKLVDSVLYLPAYPVWLREELVD